MFRIVIPTIVILAAIGSFLGYTSPQYEEIKAIKAEIASYNDALGNSKKLQSARKDLTNRYNAISLDSQEKLKKMLPDDIDNIRLILEIQKIVKQYPGMDLKNIKFDTTSGSTITPGQVSQVSAATIAQQNKPYGQLEMDFTVVGSYANFLKFLQDLEKNLRIIDVESISFSSTAPSGFSAATTAADTYNFNFKIRTYWLKN